jgi:hypothetical protein
VASSSGRGLGGDRLQQINMWRQSSTCGGRLLRSKRDLALVFSSHNSYKSSISHWIHTPFSSSAYQSSSFSDVSRLLEYPHRVQITTGPTGTHRSPHAYPREPAGNGHQLIEKLAGDVMSGKGVVGATLDQRISTTGRLWHLNSPLPARGAHRKLPLC